MTGQEGTSYLFRHGLRTAQRAGRAGEAVGVNAHSLKNWKSRQSKEARRAGVAGAGFLEVVAPSLVANPVEPVAHAPALS
jgi:hypothetical protein